MKVNIKKLYDGAVIPTRGSDEAAGYDLYAYMCISKAAERKLTMNILTVWSKAEVFPCEV